MISGKVALGGLTLEFGNAQRRFEDLTREVEALTRAQTTLLETEKELIEQLARTYLPELSPEAVSAGLGALSAKMQAALADQATHRRDLEKRLSKLPEDVGRRELLVAEAEGVEERAARGLDDVQRAVERELATESGHAAAVAEHREIMERRSILAARRVRLQTTANVERYHYEESKAFSYLSGRRYAEPEYRGRLLSRWLDGWLARRIDYERLARNYRILRTGPHALQAESHRLSGRAEELEARIDAQESAVAERMGLIAALEAEASSQRSLVDARVALSDARARHDRLADEIRAVDAKRGRPYEDALATHRRFLEDRTIQELVVIARSTVDPRDDDLVTRLDDVRSRLETIELKLGPLSKQVERQAAGTTSLGEVARKAVTHFTSRRSGFPEAFDLPRLIQSIVGGHASSDEALGRIAASHVKRPLLVPSGEGDFDGWFADLSSRFDPELGAVSVSVEGGEIDSEVVVYDHHGRVLHRRVSKRPRT